MEIRIGIAETADRVMRGLPGDRLVSYTRTGDEQDQKKDCRVTAAHKCSRLIGASRVVGSKASLRPTFSLQARSAESFCELSNSQTSFPPLSLTLARLLSSFVYPAWGFLIWVYVPLGQPEESPPPGCDRAPQTRAARITERFAHLSLLGTPASSHASKTRRNSAAPTPFP